MALIVLEAEGETLTDLATSLLGRERSGRRQAGSRLQQRKTRESGPGPEKGLVPSGGVSTNTHKSSLTPTFLLSLQSFLYRNMMRWGYGKSCGQEPRSTHC